MEAKVSQKEFKAKFELFKELLVHDLVSKLRDNCPKDTGFLMRNIDYRKTGGGYEISMPKYALYVEFGTPPHIIRPKNKKALAFKVNGKQVFAKIVYHPGTRPYPFIRNTFRNHFTRLVKESLKEVFA